MCMIYYSVIWILKLLYLEIHKMARQLTCRSSAIYKSPYDTVVFALFIKLYHTDGILRLYYHVSEVFSASCNKEILSGKMTKTRTITVEKQALAPAKEVAKTTPGLEMQVTDGMFLNSSKLGDVKEWKKSVIKDLREITSVVKSSESMRGVKQYAAIATGYVNIPEDGVYYISSDNEEVWIDGKLLVNNAGEVKRFSRHDSSAALSKGLHEIKVVFLGHIIGGWPSNWNDGSVKLRKADSDKFVKITPEMLVH